MTERLQRAFSTRLSDLSAAARDTLLVVALHRGDGVHEILAAAAILAAHPMCMVPLDEAGAADLVEIAGVRVRFQHPLIRSAVLHAESVVRRHAAHRALADALENDAYRAAWHRAHGAVDCDDELADALELLAGEAVPQHDAPAGVWILERSAALTTSAQRRGRRLLLAAAQALDVGDGDSTFRLLEAASRTPLSDPEQTRLRWLRGVVDEGWQVA